MAFARNNKTRLSLYSRRDNWNNSLKSFSNWSVAGYEGDSQEPLSAVIREDESTLHIRVNLPDRKPLDLYLGSNATFPDLVKTAMHNSRWFPVESIQHNANDPVLLTERRTLTEYGVENEDEVTIIPTAAPSVHISVFVPKENASVKVHRLSLSPPDWSWRRIKDKVSQVALRMFCK